MTSVTSVEAPARPDVAVKVIRASGRLPRIDFAELWRYRELLYFLSLRDLKIRYKQTLLGVGWAVLQPLMYMVVFTLFFGKLGHFYSEGKPYALLALAGPVIWLFFSNAVTQSSNSLVGNAALITKVYFPRLFAPVAPVIAGLVDLALGTVVLLVIMAGYGVYPDAVRVWVALPFVVLTMATATGVGCWLAALNVKYRDIRYIVPFLMQLWLFASPVAYSAGLLKQPWETVYRLNPMAGAVEGFRWAFLGGIRPSPGAIAMSAATGLLLFVSGVLYFRRMERTFADLI